MNAIFFFSKRAFHSTLRVGRPLLSQHGLTAARFDLLYAIHRYPFGVLQSEVRRMLGVTAPTVSRMVRSLEELGFLSRETAYDKRQRRVRITRDGIVRLRRAISAAIGSGAVQLAIDVALAGERAHDQRRVGLAAHHARVLRRSDASLLLASRRLSAYRGTGYGFAVVAGGTMKGTTCSRVSKVCL
jgi:DNA-binding MarR family transcriptional regulator